MRSFLLGGGTVRGFTGITPLTAPKSKYDYGRLIRQKEEIIELVHAYNRSRANNNNEKGKTGFSSSGSGRGGDTKMKIAKFRLLLFSS